MSSSASTYVPPCMILDDDELERAQQIRETFSKGRSYAAVAAAGRSWREPPAAAPAVAEPAPLQFAHPTRVFGTSQHLDAGPGATARTGFPNAFHSYGTRQLPFSYAAVSAQPLRIAVPSKDPPGTLQHVVRMTFYNSERNQPVFVPPVAPSVEEKVDGGPPYSPKTPPYYDETNLYGGPGAHTPPAAVTEQTPMTE